MSDYRKDFPLCNQAGLSFWKEYDSGITMILATDVEALLAKAPTVQMQHLNESGLVDEHGPGWIAHEPSTRMRGVGEGITHVGRVVLIEPIQKDTAESLLRELMMAHESAGTYFGSGKVDSIAMRAKKLLEQK